VGEWLLQHVGNPGTLVPEFSGDRVLVVVETDSDEKYATASCHGWTSRVTVETAGHHGTSKEDGEAILPPRVSL
jgi:hypothetical protein